ncbi:unnamed protein product [Colias eurytheme]|nr:unnamed protein product [Colias eurytheme]
MTQLSPTAKIDRWFSLLPTNATLSRPESGFISGVEDTDTALAEARNLLLQLGLKKKRRLFPRFTRRKIRETDECCAFQSRFHKFITSEKVSFSVSNFIL